MSNLFQFKQFGVDQTHCAMKVNTDGVLLGAWANHLQPKNILDIGAGTGVIALMLAQRFPDAEIDAVEIDKLAATTAAVNFQASPFAARLKAFPLDIAHYFMVYPDKKFDLIVSNPPFFVNLLKSEGKAKETARHTDAGFFEQLLADVSRALHQKGRFCLILPVETADLVKRQAAVVGLYVQEALQISSFESSKPHRQLLSFGFDRVEESSASLAIYAAEKEYHPVYRELLKDFLTIF